MLKGRIRMTCVNCRIPDSICNEFDFCPKDIYDDIKKYMVPKSRTHESSKHDCDTCENDGECFVTLLRCKGYKPAKKAI